MLPTDESQSCIMNYTHLTQEERYQIYTQLREGFSNRYIAWRLNCLPSLISREITRNKTRNGYFPKHAHKIALKHDCLNPKRIPSDIWVLFIFISIFNRVMNRLLLMFSSVCIPFIDLYNKIKTNVAILIYVSEIKERGNMALLKPVVS